MSTALTGERIRRPGSDETRVPINVDGGVVTELNELLRLQFMRGVGYSEFIQRAVDRALEEADEHGLE